MLAPFGPGRISERYLGWLVDPVVNEFSRRRGQTSVSKAAAVAYLEGLQPGEAVLSIDTADLGHIGNIKYGPIDVRRESADISILIGERSAWGRGFGTEAIYLVTRWLFETAGVRAVDAGSANPAFLAMVGKLGWSTTGRRAEPVQIGDRLLEWTLVALRRDDFVRRPELEPREPAAGRC